MWCISRYLLVCFSYGCSARFLLPIEPRRYAMFASNAELRLSWDKSVSEQRVVEQLDAGHDICYVAFRRLATVYPRDVVTLRVKCRLNMRPAVASPASAAAAAAAASGCGAGGGSSDANAGLLQQQEGLQGLITSTGGVAEDAEEEETAYGSMSCSIHHPEVPEA